MIEAICETVKAELRKSTDSGRTVFSDTVFGFAVNAPSELFETMYEPALCLILQGAKQTVIDGRTLDLRAGDSILISHHVPVHARITEASSEKPYIALIIRIDMKIVRGLHAQIKHLGEHGEKAFSVSASQAEQALLGVIHRMLGILQNPVDAALLADSVHQEMHLRLLQAPHAAMLRELATADSGASAISRAIDFVRKNYSQTLPVSAIAREAGMSESSFHQKFRKITGATPLQYVKSLRLSEARNLLLLDDCSVSSAAFTVGYESANQFSRDYSKRFGHPPSEARVQTLYA
ncbi:MAG: AraC family transcriptional regulator [Pseudomonadota bacterium]